MTRLAELRGRWCVRLGGIALLGVVGCGGPQRTLLRDEVDDQLGGAALAGWLQASLAAREGDFGAAAAAMEIVADAVPEDPDVRLRYARMLSFEGRHDDARLQCRLAQELDADPSAWLYDCAVVEEHAGEGAAALAMLTDAARTQTLSEDTIRAWIAMAARQGDAAALVASSRVYTGQYPANPRAWRSLAMALRDAGDPAGAAAMFVRAAETPGGEGWDAEQAASHYIELGDPEAAGAALQLCRQRYRENARCYVTQVWASVAFGAAETVLSDQIVDLARRTSGDPRQIAASAGRLAELGLIAPLERYLVGVADARPANVASLSSAAWAAYRAGSRDLAVELMQRVLVADHTNFDALNFIGYEWAERGIRLDEAEVYVREALMLRPGDANILDSLAWIHFRRGQLDEALALIRQVVGREPENAVILDHMGDICEALGEIRCARKVWTRALQIATPSDEDVLQRVPAKLQSLPPAD